MSVLRLTWVALVVAASCPVFAGDPPANTSGQTLSAETTARQSNDQGRR